MCCVARAGLPLCVCVCAGRAAWEKLSVEELLASLQLDSLGEIFQREHITMDVLVEMTNEDLQSIGVDAFGHRHKILRRTKELTSTEEELPGELHLSLPSLLSAEFERRECGCVLTAESSPAPQPGPPDPVGVASAEHVGTQLIELLHTDKDFIAVSKEVRLPSLSLSLSLSLSSQNLCHQMQSTICPHRNNSKAGGVFISYNIAKVSPTANLSHPLSTTALLRLRE